MVALAATNGVLYAAGWFDRVEGTARNGLAAFDAASGALAAWNPGLTGSRFAYDDGSVEALAVGENTLYVAGDFTRAAGRARPGLAAFDLATGAPTAWAPKLDGADGVAVALAVAGDTVYVGGSFDRMSATCDGRNLAAVDARTGEPLPQWRADVGGYHEATTPWRRWPWPATACTSAAPSTRSRAASARTWPR